MTIYLDNAATTGLDPAVLQTMAQFQGTTTGNASAVHRLGVAAATGVETARQRIAEAIGALPGEIIFTSGGTESNNCALKGAAAARSHRGRHIVTTVIEHPSVLETVRWLAAAGFAVTYLPVDGQGFVDPDEVRRQLRPGTILVSIIHANNEIGTIEPIEPIGALCRERDIYFHTDACQSLTHTTLDVGKQHIDLAALNAHKIHGPRGVGALYVRTGVQLEPLLHGGGQEGGLRSGTYNVEGIAGFGAAVGLAQLQDNERMEQLRDYFITTLTGRIPGVRLNGPRLQRLCNNVNVSFRDINGKDLFTHLNRAGVIVSAGSACHAAKDTPSHVLRAIGLPVTVAKSALRFSLSKWTTREEIDRVLDLLAGWLPQGSGNG
jgi:cysteine desulfurase